MKNIEQRVNNIVGQLNGINRMLEEKEDCLEVIVQLKAIKSAVNSLSVKIMEENLSGCLKNIDKKTRDKILVLINEVNKIN
ncbi:MAG: metal-sensitive transcriptional regulator [Patescibacteria group bacterium]